MIHAVDTPSCFGQDGSSRIEVMITVIDELIAVVIEENAWLAQGLPASRSKQIGRKTELAESFEKLVGDVTSNNASVQTDDEELRLKFVDRMQMLKTAMDENIIGLQAAIEASRRRIEAVMSAIREQVADANPYNASGRLSSKSISVGTNLRA
jgi:hypothetical protein